MDSPAFLPFSAKLVGPVTEEVWVQAVALKNLYLVMVLTGQNNKELGHKLLQFLEEENQKLDLKNLAGLSLLLEKIKNLLPPGNQLSLVLALAVGKVLYLVGYGGVAFLGRRGNLVKLIEGQERASGILEDGDLLILGSERFFQIFGHQFLAENLDRFTPEEISERLAPKISQTEENAGVAGLILSFKMRQEEDKEEEILPPTKANIFTHLLEKMKGDQTNRGGRKTLLTVAIFLILMLALSLVLGINKTQEDARRQKFDELYQVANLKYEEGKGLAGLNDVLARERLTQALKQVVELKTFSLKGDRLNKVEELEEKIKENLTILSRVYQLESLPLFWETSLLRQESKGDQLAISGDRLAILDKKNRLIFFLSAKTKAARILSEGFKDEMKILALSQGGVYSLTQEGMVYFNLEEKDQMVIKKDEGWGEIIGAGFYGGNIYLLDRKIGQIWKYTGGEGGFSAKRGYFASDIKPDLSGAKDLAIDGSIWVLLSGQILKFTQGRPESFVISGLEGSFGQPLALFTDEKSQNLYLLDQGSKKVLVLGKDGAYQAQYQAEEIGQAQDIAVSEEEKKIFLLAGSKVYYIEIK